VEYALTEEGLALRPALVALQLWAASRKGNLLNQPTNISATNLNES
jgi:DNA-binding HxlR family transcriptional regulator